MNTPWISVRHAALSELTLVVLTYNRAAMVQRLLNYLSQQAPEITLVLLDHGDDESQLSNAAAIASFSPAIRHLRLPVEMPLQEVLLKGCDEMTTRFSAFCPDDDIPVIDGIIDAVSMLITDARMVCAQGYVLSLTETDSAMYFGPVEDYVPSYDDDAPLKRLSNMMRRYQPVFFGFYRTETLVWAIRKFAVAKIFNLNIMFQEFFYAALVCSRGGIGRSHSILLWRRVAGSHTDRRRIHPYHQLIDNPSQLAADYLVFREQLIPYYLNEKDSGSSAQESGVRRLFDLVFLQFLVRHINYVDLDAKIDQLLDNPDQDYFDGLPVQESVFDVANFRAVSEFQGNAVDVQVNCEVFDDAVQVSYELAMCELKHWREKKISTEMLNKAIGSALEYRNIG